MVDVLWDIFSQCDIIRQELTADDYNEFQNAAKEMSELEKTFKQALTIGSDFISTVNFT